MSKPRFTVSELITHAHLHPTSRRVIVEGTDDQTLIEWFLREAGVPRPDVLPIEAISVPEEMVTAELGGGNRGALLACARAVTQEVSGCSLSLTFVADSDYDYVLGRRLLEEHLLLYTDCSSLDAYLCLPRILDKFVSLSSLKKRISGDQVASAITPVLTDLFAARATNVSLGQDLEWPKNINKRLSVPKGSRTLSFNVDRFVRDYLINNSRFGILDEFRLEFDRIRTTGSPDDLRQRIHGHDVPVVLSCFLKPFLTSSSGHLKQSSTVAESLRKCVELSDLESEPLFDKLLKRVRGSRSP